MIGITTFLSLSALFHVGHAWCNSYYVPPQAYGATCSNDPTDPAYWELVIFAQPESSNPCGVNTAWNAQLALIYEGTDERTTSTAITTEITSAVPSATFQFGVPLTSIQPGSVVTWVLGVADPGQSNFGYNAAFEYTQTQIQSIFYTSTTTIVTSTVSTESVVTITFTQTDSTTLPAVSTTIPCTTGIEIVTASPVMDTVTSTITPAPKTVNKIEILIVTTRLASIPCQPGNGVSHRSPRRRFLDGRQEDVVTYETPNCGPVTPTTLTTSTATSVAFSTTTDYSTAITVTTTTLTYPPPPTSTVCSNVDASRTTTQTITKTRYSIAPRKTVTNIKTYVLVETILARNARRCKPTGAPPPAQHGNTGGRLGGHNGH